MTATQTPSPARRPTLVAALVCVLSLTCFWIAQRAAHVSMIDLDVYRAEAWTVRNGADLYDMRATHALLPTTYPPFAALLFMPLTWMSAGVMRVVTNLVNLGLLVALVHLSLRLIGRRPARLPQAAVTLLVAAAAVWCEPVWTTMRYGQVNLAVAVLVLWDLTRRAGNRWAGIGIGIAAGIKLTPALFAVFLAAAGVALAVRRLRNGGTVWNVHLRRATVAGSSFLGTVALTAIALPHDSTRFWTEIIFSTDRPGNSEDTANQSLRGLLARALHTGHPAGPWLLLTAAVAVAGLAVAVAALLAGDTRLPHGPAWAAVSCAVTALMVSPISWSHHWVWAVPMVLLIATEAIRRRERRWSAAAVSTGLVFYSFALWYVPHATGDRDELHQSVGQMALSAVYPVAGAVFLTVAGVVTARAWQRRPPVRQPAPVRAPRSALRVGGGPSA